ncbi:hypothetical protein QOT17_013640 [Balamuthia mandrillaris]
MRSAKPTGNALVCPDCGLRTNSEKQSNKHRNEKPGPLLARFVCPKCNQQWGSAHAYCRNYQQCRKCKSKAYPQQAKYKKISEEDQDQRKPHKADLCERCIRGLDCSAAKRELEEAGLDILFARMGI